MANFFFTSESVAAGHPDKVCDRISDSILDLYLARDPDARVAIETLATTDYVCLAGETRTIAPVTADEMIATARDAIQDLGYDQAGFSWKTAQIDCRVHAQSADIAQGVDNAQDGDEEGAGDQGIMFGYACRETDMLMPAPLHYSHRILEALDAARRGDAMLGLGPDAKAQVTVEYDGSGNVNAGRPVRAATIVCSTQHDERLSIDAVKEIVIPKIVGALPDGWVDRSTQIYINPTGRFVIGGPDGDTGLTGRKIIVDSYGGAAPHGGGAFSGKDPTKVDRSAAYAARWLAKNIVAAGIAERCTLQLAYAIGVARPLALYINLHGTGQVDEIRLADIILDIAPLTPRWINRRLSLGKPIYTPTSSYGHFGRLPSEAGHFSWERLDLVDELKAALSA